MKISSLKCAECDGFLLDMYEDIPPVCPNCQSLTEVAAAHEKQISCPVDNTPMEKELHEVVIIDRCPKCQGTWLDRNELETAKEALEGRVGDREFFKGFLFPWLGM